MKTLQTKQVILYLDQYGQRYYARTLKELREQIGGRVSKMYKDKKDGSTVFVGYVIGQSWLTAYTPVEKIESWL